MTWKLILDHGKKVFKQSFKNLKINCSQYFTKIFDGSFERNQVQHNFNKAREDKWTTSKAIKNMVELLEKYCNSTPNGHCPCFVLPKFVEVKRSFPMFYRCEQKCEKNICNSEQH